MLQLLKLDACRRTSKVAQTTTHRLCNLEHKPAGIPERCDILHTIVRTNNMLDAKLFDFATVHDGGLGYEPSRQALKVLCA